MDALKMHCRRARNLVQRELDGELSFRDACALKAHLTACVDCREWQRQHVLLQSAIRQVVATGDASLWECPLPVAPRGRRIWSAAAVVAAGIGIWMALSHLSVKPPEATQMVATDASPVASPVEPAVTATPEARPDPRTLVQVEFDDPDERIVIPVQTRNPNVTILRMYPVIKTAQASAKSQDKRPS